MYHKVYYKGISSIQGNLALKGSAAGEVVSRGDTRAEQCGIEWLLSQDIYENIPQMRVDDTPPLLGPTIRLAATTHERMLQLMSI